MLIENNINEYNFITAIQNIRKNYTNKNLRDIFFKYCALFMQNEA